MLYFVKRYLVVGLLVNPNNTGENMAHSEIFPNPTVKQVIFAIQFPNLFFIESKIGELQMKIMNEFPESALLFQRQVVFALGENEKIDDLRQKLPQEQGNKVWKFNNPTLGYELNITTSSLSITSSFHKTYNNPKSDNRFRDIIETVLKHFFVLTNLPVVMRVGLRYIDECPFKEKTTDSFRAHFDSSFLTTRFTIEDSIEQQYVTRVKRGEYLVRYVETYNSKTDPTLLILDFDGSASNIPSAKCLETTDKLQKLIKKEWSATIKKPVYAYMREQQHGK